MDAIIGIGGGYGFASHAECFRRVQELRLDSEQ
jgi:hypothetical protein